MLIMGRTSEEEEAISDPSAKSGGYDANFAQVIS